METSSTIPFIQNLRDHWIEYLIGSTFIFAYARSRFNTPPAQFAAGDWPIPLLPTRYSTTPAQYRLYFTLYLSVLLTTFFLFSYSPALFNLTKFLELTPAMKNISAPLLVALFLTILLPTVPYLAQMDEDLRKFFWEQASVPKETLALRDTIKSATFYCARVDSKSHSR